MSASEPVTSGGGGGGGGGGGTGDDSSTTDGSSDGSGSTESVWSNVDVLTALVNNPRGFVLGAVLTTILEAVTGAVTTVVDQLVLLVGGSQPTAFNAPGETLGLADVPVAVASTIGGAGGFGARTILNGIESFNATLFDAAAAAGPFAPLIAIVVVVVEVVVAVVVLRRIAFVVADWLQLGGLTE